MAEEYVRNPRTGKMELKKKRGGMGLGGSGSTGSYSYAEDNPGMQWDQDALKSMMSMQIAEAMKKRQPPNMGGGGGGIFSSLKNLFGGGSNAADDSEESTETETGIGTDWNKWLTFGKGLMDWKTSQDAYKLGKQELDLGREQFDFKKGAYAGEVERKDTEYYDQINNANQKRKFLNLWLAKQGRDDDQVGYLKNKNYALPA